MFITSAFDSGNIEVTSVDTAEGDGPSRVVLSIRADHQSDFLQWFHFRLSGARDRGVELVISNAHEAAYEDGWPGYSACASYDRETWFRIDTGYDGKALTMRLTPEEDSVWVAYFAPYSMERHQDLIADAMASPLVRVEVLGHTLDGQALDLLVVGEPDPTKKKIWLGARQHPGETMAEWWMEGALEMLLDEDDPVARALLDKAVFYIVPNMNPDGSKRGHLRTNAAGVNLNRVWNDPNMETSPEVFLVRQKLLEVGCDLHMDIHGDEGLPYNFLAGYEGIPGLTEAHLAKFHAFQDALCLASPDFQKEQGYDVDEPGTADLKKCTDWVAHQFGCLAMTLEMPFKDNADLPDAVYGWSPERSRHLAHACLTVIRSQIDSL